jgi:hypothetical protein
MAGDVTVNSRRGLKRTVSLALHRALGSTDTTHQMAAESMDIDRSLVSKKASPEDTEHSLGVHDLLALLIHEATREAGLEVLRWLADHAGVDVSARIDPVTLEDDALLLAESISRAAAVHAHYAQAMGDGHLDPQELRVLREKAVDLIEVSQSIRAFCDRDIAAGRRVLRSVGGGE